MSFAGLSLTVILLAAAFVALVALGFTGKRRALVAGVVAFYPATMIYQAFPWYTPETAGAAIALWAGCFAVCFWALRDRVDPNPFPRFGRFGAALAVAAAAFAELVALYVAVLPLDSFFVVPAALTAAAPYALLVPIVLFLLSIA